MTPNEPTWAAQAPDPGAVVWHPEVARLLAEKGVGSGTVATDTLLLLRLWRSQVDGQGAGVEVTYDGLAEQVAMTRTRVREAIARLEKIGVLVPATVPGGGRSKLYGVDWSALGHDANVPEAPGQADEAPSTAPHRSGRGQARSGAVGRGRCAGIRQSGHLERRLGSRNALSPTGGGGDRSPGVTDQSVDTVAHRHGAPTAARSDRH